MLMLALVKRLPWSEQSSRAGQFATAELIPARIDDLAGATVGLIGMGDIGTAVAERLIPFGPRIVYSTRRRQADEETRLGATWLPLADLLHESTIVSLHLPLTPRRITSWATMSSRRCHRAHTSSIPLGAVWSTRPRCGEPSSGSTCGERRWTCSSMRPTAAIPLPTCRR